MAGWARPGCSSAGERSGGEWPAGGADPLDLGVAYMNVAATTIFADHLPLLLQGHELPGVSERAAAAIAAHVHGVGDHHLSIVDPQRFLARHPQPRPFPPAGIRRPDP